MMTAGMERMSRESWRGTDGRQQAHTRGWRPVQSSLQERCLTEGEMAMLKM